MLSRFRSEHRTRGQSLVEFALLLPILLVLLLGVADFGRVFQAGIVVESASRAGAEAAALEYLRTEEIRADPGVDTNAYYQRVHEVASAAACEEARILPNTTYAGGQCAQWPAVVVCVHDAVDPLCDGSAVSGFSAGTAECTRMSGGWATTIDPQAHNYVEVRLCYPFTTLFNLNLQLPMGAGLALGDIHLQQRATFTVADY